MTGLVEVTFCAACGQEIQAVAVRCRHCGARQGPAAPPTLPVVMAGLIGVGIAFLVMGALAGKGSPGTRLFFLWTGGPMVAVGVQCLLLRAVILSALRARDEERR